MEDQTVKKIEERELPENVEIPLDLLNYIPEESAKHYKMAPLALEEGSLVVGAINPDNLDLIDALNFLSSREGVAYKLVKISEEDFSKVLDQYGKASSEVGDAVSKFQQDEDIDLDVEVSKIGSEDDKDGSKLIKEKAPVIKLVDSILYQAVEKKASDIHIEPRDTSTVVRFRVDGILKQEFDLPKKIHSPIIARIKILSSLKLDEKRRPQDGRFTLLISSRKIDFRVSTFPTSSGEKTTLRVLDKGMGIMTLEDIGIDARQKQLVLDAIKKPYGLILATGPTGSGKSTTLYSLITLLDREKKNIVSLEDPVEYAIDGVNQSEVRAEIGYTFANGLRSILRGDPDILFVGEIRDSETAQLAVQAALTGHLVFSTIHTNNAAGAIPRLIDFGIDPFFIAPTLKLIVAQRLLRKLCNKGTPAKVEKAQQDAIEKELADLPEEYKKRIPKFDKFYDPKPTKDCPDGMQGRVGVFEVLSVDKKMERVILENPSEPEIQKLARKNGMVTMYEDAVIKASEGLVPFVEVNKVAGEIIQMKEIDDGIDTSIQDTTPEVEEITKEDVVEVDKEVKDL